MALPVKDLSSTFNQSADKWNSVAEELLQALRSTGFIHITGHGIDLDLAKTTEGKWIPVTPVPGSVVVSVGEILEICTNGYLKATPHPILMHDKDDASLRKDRHSLIFFSTSHDDAPVVPLASKFIASEEQQEMSEVMKRFHKADKGNLTTLQYLEWRRQINSDTV